MDFILMNADAIGGILVFLALAVYATYARQWALLKEAALGLMLSAERLMATEEGKKKFEAVYADLWTQIPPWFKQFVTPDTLRQRLQDWYDIAKNMLKAST